MSHGPFGEVYVIVFFGLIAVAGSYYLQSKQLPASPVLLTGLAIGCYAAAVLLVNNLRDTEADLRAGRSTLASRLGLPVCLWLALYFTRMPVGPGMNAQLGRTALVQVLVGALLVVEHLS